MKSIRLPIPYSVQQHVLISESSVPFVDCAVEFSKDRFHKVNIFDYEISTGICIGLFWPRVALKQWMCLFPSLQVDPELCSPKPCSVGPFYQPSIPDDLDMYGTGAYYRTVEAFGLLEEQGNTVSPAQLHMAAQKYCRKVIYIFFHTEKKPYSWSLYPEIIQIRHFDVPLHKNTHQSVHMGAFRMFWCYGHTYTSHPQTWLE